MPAPATARTATAPCSGGVSAAAGAWRYAFDAGHAQSAGFNAIANPANFSFDDDRDGYRRDDAGGSIAYAFAPEQELSARFLNSRLNAQFDAGPGFDDRTITTVESYALASSNRLTSFWTSRLEAGATGDTERYANRLRPVAVHDPATALMPGRTISCCRGERWRWRWSGARSASAATPISPSPRATPTPWSASIASRTGRRRCSPTCAATTARNSAPARPARLAYGYRFAPRWRASASYGTAFKAPTFNDLYFPGFSNPDLRPETARNAEVALRYASDAVAAGIVAYRNRVRDLIVFQCDADLQLRAAERRRRDACRASRWSSVSTSAERPRAPASTCSSPEDDATGHLLPRRARRHAALALEHALGPVRLSAELVASSERFDDAANTRRMGGYALLNLVAEWPFGPRWTAFARLDNALDKHYELAADYNTAGAAVFAGVRWRY